MICAVFSVVLADIIIQQVKQQKGKQQQEMPHIHSSDPPMRVAINPAARV
jgi:hypothetical protein